MSSCLKCYMRSVVEYADVATQRKILEPPSKMHVENHFGTTLRYNVQTCWLESQADRRENDCCRFSEGFSTPITVVFIIQQFFLNLSLIS